MSYFLMSQGDVKDMDSSARRTLGCTNTMLMFRGPIRNMLWTMVVMRDCTTGVSKNSSKIPAGSKPMADINTTVHSDNTKQKGGAKRVIVGGPKNLHLSFNYLSHYFMLQLDLGFPHLAMSGLRQ